MDIKRERVIPRYIEDEVRDSYINYAMSVIIGRALPDVKDGLKPVHRRVLYAMKELGLEHNKPYKKCARVTGEVLGKYHPHGDMAVYDTLVRMAQDFSLRYPLVDGQGNFGCFTKDTKVKLTDGRSLSFGELIQEEKKCKKNYAFTYNTKEHRIEIARIKSPRLTKKKAELVEVRLDNGEKIKCTLNHPFMLRDGTYREAKDLQPDDSLMPSEVGLNHSVIGVEGLGQWEDVYDLTIDKTHNFALACGVFVHNSVDGDSAAAMRYCISGDSLIVTEKGLHRIEKISHNSEVSFHTLSLNNKINHVSKWFDSGKHPTKIIETHRGFNLCGSLNHPILTWQNERGKPQFKWKLLNDIKEGDYAVISRSNLLFPKKEPSLKRYYPELKNRCEIHKLPHFMNGDLAFILGAVVSEGNIGREQIGFCNNDREFIEKFKVSFKRAFPDCRLHEFVRRPAGYTKKSYTSLEIHSLQIIEFLKNLGLTPGRAKERVVPEIIFQSSKKSVASFLRGFSEGDGSVSISSSLRNLELAFISASKKLMQEIQILLLRFGIDSSYRFQRPRNVFKLFIRSYENLNLFKDQIGFVTERKRKKLDEISKRNSSGWVMSKMDFVPYLADYIRKSDKYKKYKYKGCREWLIKRNIDRYTKIEKHWSWLKEILDEGDLRLYENLRRNRYIFDKIALVRDGGIRRVYSIKVDSPCHSFVSNGFISHNTEARLARITDEMLADIDKDTVDFVPNFDGSLREPSILPARLPNLLVNGSSGIAVGMATNVPPHNLNEVADGIIRLIESPNISIEELMRLIQGPDFPTGGFICGREGIRKAYRTGRGLLQLRAKAHVETRRGGRQAIIITEIPYQVNKANLIESVASLVEAGTVEGVADLRDESDREGMRIAVELKRDQNAQITLNQLYKHSQMQVTFGVIMLALLNNRPRVLNLKQVMTNFIDHRVQVVTRRTAFELGRAQRRAHILEGLKIALAKLDRVIKTIKTSKAPEQAKEALIKSFGLSPEQARAILEMQLQRLTGLERKKVDDEYLDLIKKIELYKSILKSRRKVLDIIKDELRELKKRFGDERRTEILAKVEEFVVEDLIAEEDMVITISHSGYIKRLPVSSYRKQRRGGRGVTGVGMKEEDFIEHLFIASTHHYILYFTDKGRVYWLKVYEIPSGGRMARGKAIVNILKLSPGEAITSFVPVKEFDEAHYLAMSTRKGLIKKVKLSSFGRPRAGGIIAITLEREDELIGAGLTDGKQEILLATREGKAIRFKEGLVRPMGRSAKGVRGVRLAKRDEVIAMTIVDPKATLLTVTCNGYGKRTKLSKYRRTGRGGKGIVNIKVTKRNGCVVDVKTVLDEDELMLITESGMVVRCPVKDIRTMGRNTQGVRAISLKDKDKVVSCAKVVAKEEEG